MSVLASSPLAACRRPYRNRRHLGAGRMFGIWYFNMRIKINNYTTKIDKDELWRLEKYKYHVSISGNKFYVKRSMHNNNNNKNIKYYLHREIMNCPNDMEIDHINGNSLDNRKCNLRICLHEQNVLNQKLRSNNKTGFRGVYYEKRRKHYVAIIKTKGITKYLGHFKNIKDASVAYKIASKKYHGEYGRTK